MKILHIQNKSFFSPYSRSLGEHIAQGNHYGRDRSITCLEKNAKNEKDEKDEILEIIFAGDYMAVARLFGDD